MQAEAAEQRALGTVCQSPVLMTSGAGGVNLQFNSSTPCDSTPHGDSLAYANPRSSGAQQPIAGYLQHTSHTEMDAHGAPRHLVTSSDQLNLAFCSSAAAESTLGDPREGPHLGRSSHHRSPVSGPQLRYSTVGGAPPRMTHANPASASRYMKTSAEGRRQPKRPTSAGAAAKVSGSGSAIHAGRHYSPPEYYSVAGTRRRQAGSRAGPASAAFDKACASACTVLDRRGNTPLGTTGGHISPGPPVYTSYSPNARAPGAHGGGPDAGPYGSQRTEYTMLSQMAHAAHEAHAEAARQQELARQQSAVSAEAQRVAVCRHVEAQQVAVASAASESHGWSLPAGYEPIAGLQSTQAPPALLGRVNASEGEIDVGGEMHRRAASNEGGGGGGGRPMDATSAATASFAYASDPLQRTSPQPRAHSPSWPGTPGGSAAGAATASPGTPGYNSYPGLTTAVGAGASGLRAIQLITEPRPVPAPPPASSLRRSLDVALFDSSRSREVYAATHIFTAATSCTVTPSHLPASSSSRLPPSATRAPLRMRCVTTAYEL